MPPAAGTTTGPAERTIRNPRHRARRGGARAGLRRFGRRDRRGVSDVVGTILLLALTVTLFSSIFLFVDSFPQPPPQPASQFSASLQYTVVGATTKITGINILHLSGPTLAGSSVSIYLYSSAHPTRFTSAFSLLSGLNGSKSWNLGQTWYQNITSYALTAPDNITVSIISTTQLLFRVTLPGSLPVLPPQFVATGTSPATPAAGQAFTLYAQISDPDLKSYSVYANVSTVPGSGLPTLNLMTYSASLGEYILLFPSGANAVGTYYVFVNASDTLGQKNAVAIGVTITAFNSVIPPSGASIAVSPLPVVNRSTETIYATIANTASTTAAVSVTFYAAGSSLGTATGSIPGGGTTTLSKSWTPTKVGTAALSVVANISGGGNPTGAYNVTVFPKTWLIAHGVVAGSALTNNTSAYLAQEIQADGFPFTQTFIPCNTALSTTAATYQAYDLVIIDFGSQSGGPCAASPSTTVQTAFDTAMGSPSYTQFLVVGADFFKATACSSYTGAFLTDVGISGTTTCFGTATGVTNAVTYTGTPAQGFRSDGVGTLTVNKTLAGSAGFTPVATFSGGTVHSFLATGGVSFGSFNHAATKGKGVAIGTDPALFVTTLPAPASAAWGINPGGAEVLYNALNYLTGFASTSSPGRAFADYAIVGAQIVGLSASHLSSVYVTLRANGPIGGLVQASLTVNGPIALYQGAPVSTSAFVSPNGQNVTIVLTWEAPAAGSYNLGVTVEALVSGLYGSLTMLPLNILNAATVFGA